MIIDNAGTYTLKYTATDECGNSTTVDRTLEVKAPVYGVEWDGSESTRWTRLGKSALFAEPSPAVNNGTGSSPFDGIMPWSGMEIVEDAEAGTLVSIPKFYYKWTRGIGEEGNGLRLEISSSPQDGFFTSPAHMDRGDGVGERDVVYVGRYLCTTPSMKSLTGVAAREWLTIDGFRTNIHNLGADIWQFDFAMLWTIRMLYLVEFADWDSQRKIGLGTLTGNAMGGTDSMQYHTGTTGATKEDASVVQYRHIEGLWSSRSSQFVDGLYFSNYSSYVTKNPADFNDPQKRVFVANPKLQNEVAGIAKEFSIPPSGYEFALIPVAFRTSDTATYDTYVADQFESNYDIASIHSVTDSYSAGLFEISGLIEGASGSGKASRLMKLPSV